MNISFVSNTKYITHNLQVNALADQPLDKKNPEDIAKRINDYFRLCGQNDMKPSVAGLALAFGISRIGLYRWVTGEYHVLTTEGRQYLERAYQMLNAQMEDYMQNGKINPIAGIFLMKNNMGYEDKKDINVVPVNQLNESLSQDELRRKYLNAIETDEKRMLKLAESAESAEREIIDLEEAP